MKVLLVDASQLAYRVWNIFQNPKRADLRNSKGEPTGMQFGSLRVLHAVVKTVHPDRIVFCWDRHPKAKLLLDPNYKSNRVSSNEAFRAAVKSLKAFWSLFGAYHAEADEQEADDVVASVIKQHYSNPGDQCFILSSDNDFLQLVEDGHVIVIKPPLGAQPMQFVDEEKVKADWGVAPVLMPHLRALLGDDSDTLVGIPRFNKKKAADLISQASSVVGLYEQLAVVGVKLSPTELEKVKAHQDRAMINLQLMRMQVDLPIISQENVFSRVAIEAQFQQLEIKSYLSKLDELEKDFTQPPRVKTGEGTCDATQVSCQPTR